jgi:hypothetical protein
LGDATAGTGSAEDLEERGERRRGVLVCGFGGLEVSGGLDGLEEVKGGWW